jgi:hypothetical protein
MGSGASTQWKVPLVVAMLCCLLAVAPPPHPRDISSQTQTPAPQEPMPQPFRALPS